MKKEITNKMENFDVETDESVSNENFVRSFARGLSVIQSFSEEHPEQTLADVATNTGLSRATVRRLLYTLMALGYVENDERFFRLTPKILQLGFSYLATVPFLKLAEPIVNRIVRDLQESSSIAMLDGGEIVYLLRVPTQKILTINLSIGSRLAAPCTALGKVLLSDLNDELLDKILVNFLESENQNHLPKPEFIQLKESILKVREQGWCIVNQELEQGLSAIAVPIFGKGRRIIAAMNIFSISKSSTHAENLKNYLPVLLSAAEEISSYLVTKEKWF